MTSSSEDSDKFPGGYQFFFTDELITTCDEAELIVALFHFFCVTEGFKMNGKTALPDNWKEIKEPYILKYDSHKGKPTNLECKILKIGENSLMFHTSLNESVNSAEVKITQVLNPSRCSADNLFMSLNILKESFSNLLKTETKATSIGTNTDKSQNPDQNSEPHRPPFLLGAQPIQPSVGVYPVDYGRADLNPMVPPGPGGMIFPMPQRGMHPSNIGPYGPEFGRIPHGSVPPGARFDPFSEGQDPTRFGPEPDHMRMPGSNRSNFDRFI